MTTSRSRGAGRQGAGDPSTRAAATGESDAPARRGAVALWAAIAALTIVRAALAFVPSTALWSLGLQRFLSPVVGWGLWALLAVGLIPPVARRVTPALDALGAWLARARAAGSALAFLLGAALPALFPDRVRFVGDFLLRQ